MALPNEQPALVSPEQLFAFSDQPLVRLAELAAFLLAVLALLNIACDAVAMALRVPFDPREGWNAYLAFAAASGQPLYPASPSLWYDNYPPLSFFVVGGLGRLIGDDIVAGRLVSLLSTLATASLIAALARHMRASRFQSFLAVLMFLASPWLLAKFATIDDPQMLGQALGTAGMAVVLCAPRRHASIAAGALLMTLAEFVKPTFIIQPLALIIWLGLYEPKSAVALAASALLLGAAGVAIADAGLHADIIRHILFARSYTLSRAISHPGQWCITGLVPLLATLSLFRLKQDRYAIFCAIYAIVAIVLGVVFSSGDGVGGNMTFDASIAVSLGFAVFLSRFPVKRHPRAKPAIVLACLVPFAIVVSVSALGGWSSGPSISNRFRWAPMARADIGFFEQRPGIALCEMESLCYWAGKQRLLDIWGFTETLATGGHPPNSMEILLKTRHIGAIQLAPRTQFTISSELYGLLQRNYRVDHRDALGTFYVPREAQ